MKKIAAVLLTMMVLLASASLSEEMLPANLSEGSRLIGLLITREDLSVHTGESGVLLAECLQSAPDGDPEYIFGDVRGLRLICFMLPDAAGEGNRIVSNMDDGFTDIDYDINEDSASVKIDGTISVVPGQEEMLFFFNPVLLAVSGQVFAIPGDFMAVSAAMNPIGSSVGQTIREERKHDEKGMEITDTTTVAIQISAVREPMESHLLQFGEMHDLLKREEFLPGAVPDQIVPLTEAEYLLLETVEKNRDGESFIRREAIGRDMDFLNTLSSRDDGICICHYHDVFWK